VVQNNWWETRWVRFLIFEWEFLLGLWLMSGYYLQLARVGAVISFTMFLVYNLWQIYQGEIHCDCFGALLHIDPLVVLILDLIILVALLSVMVEPNRKIVLSHKMILFLSSVGGLIGTCGIIVHLCLYPEHALFTVFDIESREFDFGLVGKGKTLKHSFVLTNTHSQPLRITHTHASCGCTTIQEIFGKEVSPGQSVHIPVDFHVGFRKGVRTEFISVYYICDGYKSPA
jgi:hypothetical protein